MPQKRIEGKIHNYWKKQFSIAHFQTVNHRPYIQTFFLSLESKTVFSVMASARRHECVGVEDEIQASSHLISECPFCEVNDASKS